MSSQLVLGGLPHRPEPESPIILEARGLGDRVAGWDYLWAKYVWGFHPEHHCANCLAVRFSKWVRPGMPLRQPRVFDEVAPGRWKYLYVCGIPVGGRWRDNLHFPLEPAPGEECSVLTFAGVTFHAQNARPLEIRPLPKGYRGRSWEFTTCRNWRFGVQYFGPVPKQQASRPLCRRCGRPATSGRTRAAAPPAPARREA